MSNFIKRLFERPAPVINFEFDESRIAIAKPGDLVILKPGKLFTGAQREHFRDKVFPWMAEKYPELRFLIVEGDLSVQVNRGCE